MTIFNPSIRIHDKQCVMCYLKNYLSRINTDVLIVFTEDDIGYTLLDIPATVCVCACVLVGKCMNFTYHQLLVIDQN